MVKKFVFRSNKYNVTHQDIQRGIEDRGYVDSNPNTSNQTNPLDKWYTYSAARNDENIFPSSSVNISRIQIHDAVNRYFDFLSAGQVKLSVDLDPVYHVGFNFNKQKLFNYVEEYLLQNPDRVFEFTKDPQQFLVSIPGLPIKNILIYQGGEDETNTTLPLLKTNIGEKVGHHKDGRFERGLQGPFTEHNVGGYQHRHQQLGKTSDRSERFKIDDNGTTITITSPISGNLNAPYARYSRDGFTKSVVNIKNIRVLAGSNTLGNFDKNYQIVNGLHRKNQNLAFVDRPQNFSSVVIDNPFLTGVVDYAAPDRTLLDGTYNKTVYVNKFGAPGDIYSSSPVNADASEEYTAYNTVNYRNLRTRLGLQQSLAEPSYFGGYLSGSFGISASYQKQQRNNRRIPVSGTSTFRLREDNGFINYQIPARDGGFSWIERAALTGNNPGLYINGIDNDIQFYTSSVLNESGPLSGIGGRYNWAARTYIPSGSFNVVVTPIPTLEDTTVLVYNLTQNKEYGLSTKRQISNHDNKLLIIQRNNNVFADQIYLSGSDKQLVYTKDSAIKDKYTNVQNVYEKDGVEETLSYELAQKYSSIMSNYYDAAANKIDNFYKDFRNINFKDKSKSLFKRLIDLDKINKAKNLNIKKIKKIKYEEKLYPRGQNTYRNFARVRNAYTQKWADNLDNRLTEITNSQGQVYYYDPSVFNSFSDGLGGYIRYPYSFWPMDADTYYASLLRDKSGELTQLDNPAIFSQNYPGFASPIVVPSGSYFGARFGRNWNTNRPANVVHEQAGRGPFPNSYEQFYSDIRLIGQDCSVIPEYRISPRLDEYYTNDYSYYDNQFNVLELTGTTIEDSSIAVSTSSAFLEQRVNSDYVDLNSYMNQELADFKLDKIKIKVKGIKKFLPYDGFYPQQRMLNLATQFSSSYNGVFSLAGSQSTFRTALTPFYAPGIGFNSIKAGVGMPFSVVNSTASNVHSFITSSIDNAASIYYKLPWSTILNPLNNLSNIDNNKIYDVDPNIIINSTASLSTNPEYNPVYDYKANNFYSEVVNFFKESSKLTSLNSTPSSQWYFPDLTKKYSLDIILDKKVDFLTYSSLENFGPKPYYFHAPPWYRLSSTFATSSTYNSDKSLTPNAFKAVGSSRVTITFDPSSLAVGTFDYFLKGKFGIGDVIRNSTITYQSATNTSSATVQLTDIVDVFSVSADGQTWQPKLYWECPTADLNFYGLSAKLTNSSGNDSGGGTIGDAIRGIWHQYAPISNNNEGLFLSVRDSNVDTTLTGSLLDVVGFNKAANQKVGKISSSRRITEGLVVIPYYLDDCGVEKYFDINVDVFERLYIENVGIVGEIKSFSRNYVLPPQLDFIKFRDDSRKRLEKDEYKLVKSPFIMFPFQFSSVLTQQDLADIWQGVLPASTNTAEIDYQEREFFIGNYLKDLNFKLPDNTRFKIFKVKKRAVVNYEEINYKSLGYNYADRSYGYNWPYDYFSLLEMAEIRAELVYGTEISEDSEKLNIVDDQALRTTGEQSRPETITRESTSTETSTLERTTSTIDRTTTMTAEISPTLSSPGSSTSATFATNAGTLSR